MSSVITVLHPGQMGAAVAHQLRLAGHDVLWVTEGRSAATANRAAAAGLRPASRLGEALAGSDIVFSICPPAAAEDLAAQVAAVGFGGVYVEANAVSPGTVATIKGILKPTGAALVDGSIIGPLPGGGVGARLYLAGGEQHAEAVAALFAGTLVSARVLDREPGAASALKMAFAAYQKSARTLAAVAHALADDHGVSDELLAEAASMPSDILLDREYLRSVAPRAWRWGPEMQEIARTLREAGLPDDLALAASRTLAHWATLKDTDRPPLTRVLAALHRQPS
ncbi:NAD(P)-dependent oxidoreductase [Kitasatospora acidiphila]|uniref:NAD(P)-dependent oxidoreductase n=1 Tax=Kitasatospora acidiphila TaxID=2567942 RepID=A0A540VX54_9ACTN|nr:NAD(P)-dependent oxidoreductase [Kitasatospora acidiphila]TQF01339.1 NAD(P)-dependent oxidoreductase [Kitasatospora acidiphila]